MEALAVACWPLSRPQSESGFMRSIKVKIEVEVKFQVPSSKSPGKEEGENSPVVGVP